MGKIHRLVPDFILKNYAAQTMGGTLSGAVLFADITGFSKITDSLLDHGPHGSEVLAKFIRAAFSPLIEAIYSYGGFIAIQAGDSCTAVFLENEEALSDCKSALAAAQRMQQIIRESPIYQTPYGSFTVSLKIGLAYGDIRWGIIESEDQQHATYYFMGSAIDNSVSAEHKAIPGEIILDKHSADVLAGINEMSPLDDFFLQKKPVGDLPEPGIVQYPVVDLELASRFFPRSLFRQDQEGELRQVVNLFISLPTVREKSQLNGFMQTCFELMDRYGGLLNRLDFGDKGAHLLMFWGAPTSFENDIKRVLMFVLDLQRRTAIPINAGVTYQMAHAGYIGSELKEEYTAFGRGVNLAARFMTTAPRGEVWIDEAVAQVADRQFVIEPEGEMIFKGFRSAQKAFTLIEHKDHVDIQYRHKMVGRQNELDQLDRFIAPIFKNEFAGAALLLGEAGIGKTRLLHELSRHLEEVNAEGFQIFRGQCDEILRGSLNPIRFWLRDYFQFSDFQVEARNKRNFNRRLDKLIMASKDKTLAEELDRTRSFLGAILGLYWPDSLYEQLGAKERYENTMAGLTGLIRCESLKKPTIFFLEDIHWMDKDTRVFLRRLLQILSSSQDIGYPIAIINTARPTREFFLEEGQRFYTINLQKLSEACVNDLSEIILSGPASHELLNLINEKSEGNPLFAEQTLYYLCDKDLVSKDQGNWTLSEGFSSGMPGDIRRLLTSRLDLLPEDMRENVQMASVLGREFDENLLAYMLDDPSTVDETLRAGLKAGLWTASMKSSFLFSHALLWEVIYRMQLRERRRMLHARAFTAAEHLYQNNLQTRYGELAHHAEHAQLNDKAVFYLKKAGDSARENYQNTLAEDFYGRALRIIPDSDLEGRFEILLSKQDVNGVRGEYALREKDLQEMQYLVMEMGDSASQVLVSFNIATLAFDMDNTQIAAKELEKILVNENAIADREIVCNVYSLYSMSLNRLGNTDEGIEIARKGLALARQSEDLKNQSFLLNSLGMLMIGKHEYDQATAYLKESLEIANGLNDLYQLILPLNNLGLVAGSTGDYSSAQDYYQQSHDIAKKIGNKKNMAITLGNLGWLAGVLGEIDKALSYNKQQLEIARDVGNRFTETYSLINLGAVLISLGQYEDALIYAEKGSEVADSIQDISGKAWAMTYAGHSLVGLSRYLEAETAYQEALEIRREQAEPALAAEPLCGLAQVALAQKDLVKAKKYGAEVQDYIESGGSLDGTDDPLRVMFTCYLVRREYDAASAQAVLERAYQGLMDRAAQIVDPEIKEMYLENIPLHKKIIQAWEARMIRS